MHFCQDEMIALMTTIPFFGYVCHWVKSKVRKLREPLPDDYCPPCQGPCSPWRENGRRQSKP